MFNIFVLHLPFNSVANLVKRGKWTQLNIMGNNCKCNLSRKLGSNSENVISVSSCEIKAFDFDFHKFHIFLTF